MKFNIITVFLCLAICVLTLSIILLAGQRVEEKPEVEIFGIELINPQPMPIWHIRYVINGVPYEVVIDDDPAFWRYFKHLKKISGNKKLGDEYESDL